MLKDIWEIVNGKIEATNGEVFGCGLNLSETLTPKPRLRSRSRSNESVACSRTVGVSPREVEASLESPTATPGYFLLFSPALYMYLIDGL
jgi:hypothetical protein